MTAKNPLMKLMNTIICRTPVFGVNDDLQTRWPELKELIKDASPEFQRIIAEWSYEELVGANEKIMFSVWKYFNRSRFRSTPFGNFAAISFAAVGLRNERGEALRIKSGMLSHRFSDWSESDGYLQTAKTIVQVSKWFQGNITCYIAGDQLRYIRNNEGQFELASVVVFEELTQLLAACRTRQSKPSVYELMFSAFGMRQRAVDSLLCQLIECQLLFTEQMPNIIGEDYFERLSLPKKNNTQYIIAERELNSGRPDTGSLGTIPAYLDFIKNFAPQTQNAHLEAFKRDFRKKFDMRAVPLGIALDPETGVCYGDMAQHPQRSALSAVFSNMQNKEPGNRSFTYTSQHRFLLNALMKGDTIRLEAFEGQADKNPRAMPNTLSVMYQHWNGMPVLQNAGGCTANSLLGRFTLGCEKAEEFARQIVDIEETANPDVLFFDIAYQAEKRVDNVNRRKQAYHHELPILTWSYAGSVLSMEDMMLMLREDELILWSKQYNKRLVPRIATAYNYNRSDLAVYRFLCDLQHQHIQSDLIFNLQQLFPGLDRYPRVMYENIVVSPAMWKVDLQAILHGNKANHTSLLKDWLRLNHIGERFKCGKSDQTLCFDPEYPQDMQAFLNWCRQNNEKDIYIQEALIDETSFIADENDRQYLPQYIASYCHNEQVYRPLHAYAYAPVLKEVSTRAFLPGSEWIYFEIYSHPQRANDILEQCINITDNQKRHLKKWFFIRYTDPKPHIRLRLQVKDPAFAGLMIARVKRALEPLWGNGFIADMQVKTYQRETERYGYKRIDKIEELFHLDSRYVLRLLAKDYSIDQLHHLTLKKMERFFALAFDGIDQRLSVIKTISDSFSKEFAIGNEDYKIINRSFEALKAVKTHYPPFVSESFLKQYEIAFCSIIADCSPNEKINMAADVVHMHINRVFSADQRMHEAILSQYLLKLVKGWKYHAAAEPALL